MTPANGMIYIGDGSEWIRLPAPSEYAAVPNEIHKNAGRNLLGNLVMTHVATKRTLTLQWNAVRADVKDSVLGLTAGGGRLAVRYYDPQEGAYRQGDFYRGSDLQIVPRVRWDGTEFGAYDVRMSLVEI